jgi:hypothetical protein
VEGCVEGWDPLDEPHGRQAAVRKAGPHDGETLDKGTGWLEGSVFEFGIGTIPRIYEKAGHASLGHGSDIDGIRHPS